MSRDYTSTQGDAPGLEGYLKEAGSSGESKRGCVVQEGMSLRSAILAVLADELGLEGKELARKATAIAVSYTQRPEVQQYLSRRGNDTNPRYAVADARSLDSVLRDIAQGKYAQSKKNRKNEKVDSYMDEASEEDIEEEPPENLPDVRTEDIRLDASELKQEPMYNEVDAYFAAISGNSILSREEEQAQGREHVSARERFTYAVLRSPHAALGMMRELAEFVAGHPASTAATLFEGKDGLQMKVARQGELLREVETLESRAGVVERTLAKVSGSAQEPLIEEYQGIQSKIKQLFVTAGFRAYQLAPVAARNKDNNVLVAELDNSLAVRESYAAYQRAREALFLSIARLGAAEAVKFVRARGRWGDLLDVIGYANTGIMKALDRWDPERGNKLSTYASWYIKQAVNRDARAMISPLTQSQRMVQLVVRFYAMRREFIGEQEREPDVDDIAQMLGLTQDLAQRVKAFSRTVNLDKPVGDDATQIDFLGVVDSGFEQIESQAESAHMLERLGEILNTREYYVIYQRFVEGRSLEDIGKELGITRERVRQLESMAKRKMEERYEKKRVSSGKIDDSIALDRQGTPYATRAKQIFYEMFPNASPSEAVMFARNALKDKAIAAEVRKVPKRGRFLIIDKNRMDKRLVELAIETERAFADKKNQRRIEKEVEKRKPVKSSRPSPSLA